MQSTFKSGIFIGLFFILLAVAFYTFIGKISPKGQEAVKQVLPGNNSPTAQGISIHSLDRPLWDLEQVAGATLDAASFTDKVLLLDFWATWCKPCRFLVPHLSALQAEYGDQDFLVVGICLDGDGVEAIQPTIDSWGMDYPVLLGNEREAKALGEIMMIPTTFLINRQGKVVEKFVGVVSKEILEQAVRRELNQESAEP